MKFGGFESCILDSAGRLKLSSHYVKDFDDCGGLDVVLHCWPEGGLAVLPARDWNLAEVSQHPGLGRMLFSPEERQKAREMMSLTCQTTITNQQRITLPQAFRERCGLVCGEQVIVAGTGSGLEIWSCKGWEKQLGK